jgi:hypothetical protein
MSPGHVEIIHRVLLLGPLLVVLCAHAEYPLVLQVRSLYQRRTALRASIARVSRSSLPHGMGLRVWRRELRIVSSKNILLINWKLL